MFPHLVHGSVNSETIRVRSERFQAEHNVVTLAVAIFRVTNGFRE